MRRLQSLQASRDRQEWASIQKVTGYQKASKRTKSIKLLCKSIILLCLMVKKQNKVASIFVLFLTLTLGCQSKPKESKVIESIEAAGASFPARLYQRWFYALSDQGIFVNYKSVGSSKGIDRFKKGISDFGASDIKITDKNLTMNIIQFPAAAGGIAVAYNNKDCQLKLSKAELIKIFLQEIQDYAHFGCSSKKIQLITRSDASGTTYNFSKYLSSISDQWRESMGTNKNIQWVNTIRKEGNEGVILGLKETDGGMGYATISSVPKSLMIAKLENQDGMMVEPTEESMRNGILRLIQESNDPGEDGYPLVNLTWIFANKANNLYKADDLKNIFTFMLSDDAQKYASDSGFIPLPRALRQKYIQQISSISF